jgi:hypothetical protein
VGREEEQVTELIRRGVPAVQGRVLVVVEEGAQAITLTAVLALPAATGLRWSCRGSGLVRC